MLDHGTLRTQQRQYNLYEGIVMKTRIERTVITEAYEGNNGLWLYEGFTSEQWLAIGEAHRAAHRRNEADEAYLISGALQGLDNNR